VSDLVEFLRFLEARLAERGIPLRAWPIYRMRLLALQHADHPDYNEKWKP
jgi:hypothetical protein